MALFASIVKPLAYVSLPLYALKKFADASPFARRYVRLTLFVTSLGICSAWGAICAVCMGFTGHSLDVNYVVARSFYNLAGRLLDIQFDVEGEEHLQTRPAVLIGNHQSMIDILFLGRIFPRCASIMAKKELRWVPLFGWWMSLSGAVFVDRGNNARAVRSLTAAGELMKSKKMSLWLFPEGTRSMRPHHDMGPFKKGAFHTAIHAGVPIIPVVCENYWRLYHKGIFESGRLKIKVLPPIPTEGLTTADVTDLALRVRTMMVETLAEISAPTPASADTKSRAPETAVTSSPLPPPAAPAPVVAAPDVEALERKAEEVLTLPPHDAPLTRTESRASNSTSDSSRPEGSLNGETDEEDGMVLVGRPKQALR